MFKHLALAAACVGLIACGGTESTEQPPEVTMDGREVVSIGEMVAGSPDGKVTVDMRNSNLGFRVEKGLDLNAITIICPSSRVMSLDALLVEAASQTGKAPSDYAKGITMFPFMAGSEGSEGIQKPAPICIDDAGNYCDSEREPNGSWTCLCGNPV
ncbi:hypothetical protein [Pyxidicoccus trucidator]|uniref:hypothetical protein n=1 Tax=Pyxidicoccus trucidator TaxID=2709662 RepID=UPI0013DD779F|nr:hypothetical protein [Pyxidicoccus trucidator]